MPPAFVPQRLRDLIAALDRRAPQPLRPGEATIQRDAAALRTRATVQLEALAPLAAGDDDGGAPAPPQSTPEWHRAAGRHNALLVGTPAATSAAVAELLRRLPGRIVVRRASGQSLDLTDAACRTLIVEDLATLTALDQGRLARWIEAQGDGVQVVSTTPEALYPLVQRGAFDAGLYYRLNVLYVEV